MTSSTFDFESTAPGGTVVPTKYIAFEGHHRLAFGHLPEVVSKVKVAMDNNPEHGPILIFDAISSRPIDINFYGSLQKVLEGLANAQTSEMPNSPALKRGPGRPRLGVVGREVTLLPRHWEWLDGQPGGASVALRKLVEKARHSNRGTDIARQSQEAVYRFMSDMAGDLPGFEEALRAFYRGNRERVDDLIRAWPPDVRDHLRTLIATAYHDAAEARKR